MDIIGKVFKSNNYGEFRVMEKTNKKDKWGAFLYNIKFLETGYETLVNKDKIKKGTIRDWNIYIGKTFYIEKYGHLKINKIVGTNQYDNVLYEVEFLKTGYKTIKTLTEIKQNKVKDRFCPHVCDVGFLGNSTKVGNEKIYYIWKSMLTRCYLKTHPTYKNYGEIGVTVCDRWHCFENFLEDLPKIEGYEENLFKNGQLEIDKDLKQENIKNKLYSLETCCFINHTDNMIYKTNTNIKFKATSPNGEVFYPKGITSFSKEHHMSPISIKKCLNGEKKHNKNWIFEKILENEVI